MNSKASRSKWVSGIRLTGGLCQLGLGIWVLIDVIRATITVRNSRFGGEGPRLNDPWSSLFYADHGAVLDACFWCPYRYIYLWGIWFLVMGLWIIFRHSTWDWWLATWGLFLGFDIISDSLRTLLYIWVFQVLWDGQPDVVGTFMTTVLDFLITNTFSNIVSLIASGLLGVGVWLIARRFFLAKGPPSADADTMASDSRSPSMPESPPAQ